MSGIIEQKQMFQEMRFISTEKRFQYVLGQVEIDHVTNEYDSDFLEKCSSDDSCDSFESLSSSEMVDDATSSHDGPLYELSELMAQLPIKRGLSKYYQGKSESFGSLANLNNIEDLAKKSHKSRRLTKSPLSPKSIITKNKKSSSSYVARSSLLDIISVQNYF